ncbi:MAG: hypothetical protein ACYDCI_00280 [Candidatus Limnocylindrales bacterium]
MGSTERSESRSQRRPPDAAARRLVQIVSNGSMPTATGHYFAAVPVDVGGTEVEGGTATTDVGSAVMYVDVIGSTVPSVGDQLVAYGVGGRWVAERGGNGAAGCCQTRCAPCSIPQKDLQLDYTNLLTGNGTTTLHYSTVYGYGHWESDCTNGLIYTFQCAGAGGKLELLVTYYTTGSCPDGQPQYCTSLGNPPYALSLVSSQCQPFSATFVSESTGCPALTGGGYTQFVVSDPSPVAPTAGLMCQTVCLGVSGVDVQILSDGHQVAAGATAGALGCIYLIWPGSPGVYTVVIGGMSYPNQTLACAGQWGLCSPCSVPNRLTATLVCSTGTYTTTAVSGGGAFSPLLGTTCGGNPEEPLIQLIVELTCASGVFGFMVSSAWTACVMGSPSPGLAYLTLPLPSTYQCSPYLVEFTDFPADCLGGLFFNNPPGCNIDSLTFTA